VSLKFPITFEHQGRLFTLSLGSASGTIPLFPRDARGGGEDDTAVPEPVVVLEVSDDATQYACGDPGRYRDEEVLKARVTLWYHTLRPSGPPLELAATRRPLRRR
jgi:hypothetical protein